MRQFHICEKYAPSAISTKHTLIQDTLFNFFTFGINSDALGSNSCIEMIIKYPSCHVFNVHSVVSQDF